jgi:DNA invertase Pin-like site-specific DNA recombinase
MSESHSIRGVTYFRMSTGKAEQEASIPEQQRWAEHACQAHRVDVVQAFEDPGIPGSELIHRPGLLGLLAFCEAQCQAGTPIDAVVCWDADRFSRADSIRTAACIARLLDAGVSRMLCSEGWIDWGNDVDRVLYNLRQDLSKSAYSKGLSKNVTRGMAAEARAGKWLGAKPPYGYAVGPDRKLCLGDPVKAEAVRWMFRTYADTDTSLSDLARELERRGVPAPAAARGKRWNRYTVRKILMNPRYTGDAVWNALSKGKYHKLRKGAVIGAEDAGRTSAKRRRNLKHLPGETNAPEDMIVVPGAHPALADRETFARVQEKLPRRYRTGTTPIASRGEWTLSGMLFCADCGAPMWGCSDRQRQRDGRVYLYRRYTCASYRRLGARGCRRNEATPEQVLEQVVGLVQAQLSTPDSLAELRREIDRKVRQADQDHAAHRQALQARLDTLSQQIDQGNRNLALLPTDRLPGVVAQVRTWEAERDQAAKELTDLDTQAAAGSEGARRAGKALGQLKHLGQLVKKAPPAVVREALRGLVSKVTLHFDRPEPGTLKRPRQTVLSALEVELQPELVDLLTPANRRRCCPAPGPGFLAATAGLGDNPE